MKIGDVYEFRIERTSFPSTGIAVMEGKEIFIKNTFPGQKVLARLTKRKRDHLEAKLLEISQNIDYSVDAECPHFNLCGGCNSQFLPHRIQLELKTRQVLDLFRRADIKDFEFLGIEESPEKFEYRNKMEFTFGDAEKGGVLNVGMHMKGKSFGIVNVDQCKIVDGDFRNILSGIIDYLREEDLPYYRVKSRKGYLRNLVVRKGKNTGEILINMVTTSQMNFDFGEMVNRLLKLDLCGNIKGILHSVNDSFSDIVKIEKLNILYGDDHITEKISGLKFKIFPGAFFQTNSRGAEKLYGIVEKFLGDVSSKTVLDLYCGTGTIGQIVAGDAKKVIGVELIEDAVKAANDNVRLNGIENCEFISGDVGRVVNEMNFMPDVIILDPPRPGIHPKALRQIAGFGAKSIIYVSCNPKTLVQDLNGFIHFGYRVDKVKLMDMFPQTGHVETIVSLQRKDM
ncbi:MAG: 23S rRNA (uracil(1939)-C(5))-methyltransferase RlmD [Clostridium sp.]|uniref:23S rRNA (uracil(1939)-C(5))-methyltransferase RlmD n=1 Tax=Clostridium sp. TaxID=1506 RepID=UPI0025B9D944|nr:23S rRNA (uracil(1939)-C(5))-methyltransferase RlmD [Clostridium sp.]MCH3964633.1 23S rRNA (uracil(1939)-C(5))-methyltransferase RlmD [Clostridium sp.]MCI1715104.1 23S rRNA (uracil(1939)-C(5))-methyltransferase RlmD [Clostridium sp.]MCI1799366.1 23S rRNA (uracil(1939)-C(5))-methyltransferase RlmD [Clostridium sp.]MCI1813287.1 23S rRNA (uracil(1939)-C(5))-methyltransferase RlmD [Clostridium sp.]MCI1870178.1 23S rRNA (uracil(1939)-C(5))-methyltransferase RlmD [Clostridium sp.]